MQTKKSFLAKQFQMEWFSLLLVHFFFSVMPRKCSDLCFFSVLFFWALFTLLAACRPNDDKDNEFRFLSILPARYTFSAFSRLYFFLPFHYSRFFLFFCFSSYRVFVQKQQQSSLTQSFRRWRNCTHCEYLKRKQMK